jgi:hypothetical protein
VTLLIWAPNHAMPAWLATLLLLRHGFQRQFMRAAALPLAAGAFWSPLAVVGTALLTLVALLRGSLAAAMREALAPANMLAAAFAVPLCLYLVAGSTGIPHYPLLWKHPEAWAAGQWLPFLLIEVLVWAGFALLLVRGRFLTAAIAILSLLPSYVFGPGNEMTMRGGMAPIVVLAVSAAAGLVAPAAGPMARIGRTGLVSCAILAAIGSLMEASLVATHPSWRASRSCSLPEATRQSVFTGSTNWSHYIAKWPDPLLQAWLAPPEPRPVETNALARCWPDGGV